jgi:hypothetical protein
MGSEGGVLLAKAGTPLPPGKQGPDLVGVFDTSSIRTASILQLSEMRRGVSRKPAGDTPLYVGIDVWLWLKEENCRLTRGS